MRVPTRRAGPDDGRRWVYLSWVPWLALLGLNALRLRPAWRERAPRREVREPAGARLAHLAALAAAGALIAPVIPAGPLDRRWRSGALPRGALGLALEVLGLGLTFWARAALGRYWTTRVALAGDQPLLTTGPYALVRHPLYAGLLVGAAGTALVAAQPRGFLGLALLLAAYRRKTAYEEAALRAHFGARYAAYAAAVPTYLPRLVPTRAAADGSAGGTATPAGGGAGA